TVDLSVSLYLRPRRVGFLYADILGIAGKVVALLLRDVVSRFGACNARILARLRRVLVRRFRVGLGDLFLPAGFRQANVLGVTTTCAASILVDLVLRLCIANCRVVSLLGYRYGRSARLGDSRSRVPLCCTTAKAQRSSHEYGNY